MPPPILEFIGVSFPPAEDATEAAPLTIDFVLPGGELALVELASQRIPLADAAVGCVQPVRGKVRFRGRAWTHMAVDEACRARGRIGRVFDTCEWLSDLDVDENVLLPARHHTRRPDVELLEEARDFCRRLGIDDLPDARPHEVPPSVLRVASYVRALLGAPDLVVLEDPLRHLDADALAALQDCIAEVLGRGAAVLCTLPGPGARQAREHLPRGRRYAAERGAWHMIEDAA